MRKDDHQFFQADVHLLVRRARRRATPFDEENTGLGWKLIAKIDGRQDRRPDHLQDEAARRAARRTGLRAGLDRTHRAPRVSVPSTFSQAREASRVLELIVFSTLNGVLYGLLLFLLSSGLTLIFSMMGVLNFAHASFYMLGAYFGYQIATLRRLLAGAGPRAARSSALHRRHRRALRPAQGAPATATSPSSSSPSASPSSSRSCPDVLGQAAGRLSRAGVARICPPSRSSRRNYPAYKCSCCWSRSRSSSPSWLVLTRTRIGLIVQAALTHPHMVGALGHNVPPSSCWCSASAARSPASPASSPAPALVTAAGDGGFARADPLRRRGRRRARLAAGRLRRLAPHRPGADLRGRARRLARRPLRRFSASS